MKHVFHGNGYRVQLHVIDLTGPETPPAIRKDKPMFIVHVLPNYYHKSTSFAKGNQVHLGHDYASACRAIGNYVRIGSRVFKMPKKFAKYDLEKPK